jgi:hypothetical protein
MLFIRQSLTELASRKLTLVLLDAFASFLFQSLFKLASVLRVVVS